MAVVVMNTFGLVLLYNLFMFKYDFVIYKILHKNNVIDKIYK